MNKKFVAVSVFVALSLAACGTPKKSPDDASKSPDGKTGNPILSGGDFLAGCQQKNGFLTPDSNNCIVPKSVSIADGQTGTVVIDTDFHDGKALVSVGTQGAVVITLNQKRIANVNTRAILTPGIEAHGVLAFQVLLPTSAKASAAVYECFDRSMHMVWCNDGEIP